MECFRLLFNHLAWIEHKFLSGIRDSRKAGSLWGMMRGVGGVRKSIHKSWLAKGLELGLQCWGFKGLQEEIPLEKACNLQIGSVVFPPGQCTSPQLHPCHILFDQDEHQDRAPCGFWLFPKLRGCCYKTIEEMKEDFDEAFEKLLEWYKCTAAGGDYFQGDESFMCILSIIVPIRKSLEIYIMILIYIYIYIYTS